MTRQGIFLLTPAILALPLLPACGGATDTFDFQEESFVVEPGTGGTSGTGGDDGTGATDDGSSNPYRRGGYGGDQFVVGLDNARAMIDVYDVCGGDDQHSVHTWGGSDCSAGSLCSMRCETDADCAPLDGPLEARCDKSGGYEGNVCVLPCDTDADCLEGMVCSDARGNVRSCLIADVAWWPGCSDFCVLEEQTDDELCGVDADCCDGLSCSPTGHCQARECLPVSWSCAQDGVPCCEGASCQSGSCQPE